MRIYSVLAVFFAVILAPPAQKPVCLSGNLEELHAAHVRAHAAFMAHNGKTEHSHALHKAFMAFRQCRHFLDAKK